MRDQSRLKIEQNINDSIKRAEKYDKFKVYKNLLNLKNLGNVIIAHIVIHWRRKNALAVVFNSVGILNPVNEGQIL